MKIIDKRFVLLLGVGIFFLMNCAPCFSSEYQIENIFPFYAQHWHLRSPHGVAVDSKQDALYIVDSSNSRIVKTTMDGRFITTWGRWGGEKGNFKEPYGIAIDKTGSLWVSDTGRIQLFDSNGNWIAEYKQAGLTNPRGIAFSALGYVYVTDSIANEVFVFSSRGVFLKKWGGIENSFGELESPQGIAVDSNGTVFIADAGNSRIQKFTFDGDFLDCWNGNGGNELTWPEGIAVDNSGVVWVTDRSVFDHSIARVIAFSPDGEVITSFGETGLGDGHFKRPGGIAISSEGFLFVSDATNHNVQRFLPNGSFVARFGVGAEEDFNTPEGIAIDHSGRTIIADTGNNRIVFLDDQGVYLQSLGGESGDPVQFMSPSRVTVDTADNIWITDRLNGRILAISKHGEPLASWDPAECEDILTSPMGIAVNADGLVYVTEKRAEDVFVFDANGKFQKRIPLGLRYPEGISIGPDGTFWVADFGNDRVVQIDRDGNLLLEIWGENAGFKNPSSTFINSDGTILISDQFHHQIVRASPDGEFVSRFGEAGSFPGQMQYPAELAVTPDGRILVADSHNHRIQIFAPGVETLNQKAIIIAGGGTYPGNDLWEATRLSAHLAYAALKHQGFGQNRIRYYSDDVGLDLDNNAIADDIEAVPSVAALEQSITEWSADAEWLVLYLVDHGDNGRFRIGPNETLSAAQLAYYLDQRNGNTLVIIDACQAGSFAEPLSGANRIIIASAGADEPAHFIGSGAVSFSGVFWSAVMGGQAVAEALADAKTFLNAAELPQNPVAVPETWPAPNLYIGLGIQFGTPPVLNSPTVEIDTDPARLRLHVMASESAEGLSRVWAVLRPMTDSGFSPSAPIIDFPTVELARDDSGGFAGETAVPASSTPYAAALYARSVSGRTSAPVVVEPAESDTAKPAAILIHGYTEDAGERAAIAAWIATAGTALAARGFADADVTVLSAADDASGESIANQLTERLDELSRAGVSELVLYLVGGGPMTAFPVGPDETLSPNWLADYAADFESLALIWDAPHGDTEDFSAFSGPDHLVVLGFGLGPLNAVPAFSDLFWPDVARGLSIGAAFDRAAAFGGMSPALRIGENADRRYLGAGVRLAAGLAGEPPVFLNGQSDFEIPVSGFAFLGADASAWAETRRPTTLPLPDPDTDASAKTPLPEDETAYVVGVGNLNAFGTYASVVHGETADGRSAELTRINLFQNIGLDLFEPDDTPSQAKPVTVDAGALMEHSIHQADDEDWTVFFGQSGTPLRIALSPLSGTGTLSMTIQDADGDSHFGPVEIDLETEDPVWNVWTPPEEGLYYLRVAHNGETDENAPNRSAPGYGLRIDHEVAPFPGYILGRVKDESGNVIGQAKIAIKAGGAVPSATGVSSPADGKFLVVHPPGQVNVSVSAPGFQAESVSVTVPETGNATVDITLKAIAADPPTVPDPDPTPDPTPTPVPPPSPDPSTDPSDTSDSDTSEDDEGNDTGSTPLPQDDPDASDAPNSTPDSALDGNSQEIIDDEGNGDSPEEPNSLPDDATQEDNSDGENNEPVVPVDPEPSQPSDQSDNADPPLTPSGGGDADVNGSSTEVPRTPTPDAGEAGGGCFLSIITN